MLFRVISSFDDQGNPCDVTTLHDWLVNTDDKNVSIPMSHITFITEPFLKDGVVANKTVGLISKGDMESIIDSLK